MSRASSSRIAKKKLDPNAPVRLDLGAGDNKRDGFIGVDKFKIDTVDVVWDLTKRPWPWKDESVDEISSGHLFEHLTGEERKLFTEEAWRILKPHVPNTPTGQMLIVVPYWASMRSIQDFTHKWPPLCEASFLYWNQGWLQANKLTHGDYAVKCNFDFGYGFGYDQDILVRSDEFRALATKHYTNAVLDIHVTLTKRPMP